MLSEKRQHFIFVIFIQVIHLKVYTSHTLYIFTCALLQDRNKIKSSMRTMLLTLSILSYLFQDNQQPF